MATQPMPNPTPAMPPFPADNPGGVPAETPPLPLDPTEPSAPGELPPLGPDTDVPDEGPAELPPEF